MRHRQTLIIFVTVLFAPLFSYAQTITDSGIEINGTEEVWKETINTVTLLKPSTDPTLSTKEILNETTEKISFDVLRIYTVPVFVHRDGSWKWANTTTTTKEIWQQIQKKPILGIEEIQAQVSTTTITLDTWLNINDPTANYGTGTYVEINPGNSASDLVQRSIFTFDLPADPGSNTIDDIRFYLYQTRNDGTAAFETRALTRTWTETQATWNVYTTGNAWSSPGGDFGSALSTSSWSTANGRKSMPLNDMSLNWGSTANFMIKAQTEGTGSKYMQYDSSEASTASQRPYFEITYHANPTPTPTPSPTPTPTSSATSTDVAAALDRQTDFWTYLFALGSFAFGVFLGWYAGKKLI